MCYTMRYTDEHVLEFTGPAATDILAALEQKGGKIRAFAMSGPDDALELIVVAATGEATRFPIGDDLEVKVYPDYSGFAYGEEILTEGLHFNAWTYYDYDDTLVVE